VLIAVIVIGPVVGYLIGRLRPWHALDAWAENEVRFYGPWARGNRIQQVIVLVAHGVTHPRRSWEALRKGRH
jgi:hypothetical protein